MSEPIATQISSAFTRWCCKSRGTPGYNGIPVYRMLHHILVKWIMPHVIMSIVIGLCIYFPYNIRLVKYYISVLSSYIHFFIIYPYCYFYKRSNKLFWVLTSDPWHKITSFLIGLHFFNILSFSTYFEYMAGMLFFCYTAVGSKLLFANGQQSLWLDDLTSRMYAYCVIRTVLEVRSSHIAIFKGTPWEETFYFKQF